MATECIETTWAKATPFPVDVFWMSGSRSQRIDFVESGFGTFVGHCLLVEVQAISFVRDKTRFRRKKAAIRSFPGSRISSRLCHFGDLGEVNCPVGHQAALLSQLTKDPTTVVVPEGFFFV